MAKIHWLVYILVGLFVSILSWRLNYEKLIFFFYAGWVFVFIGVIKLVFNLIKKRTSKTEKMQHQKMHHQSPQIKHCSKCGNAIRLHDRFCNRCGARV